MKFNRQPKGAGEGGSSEIRGVATVETVKGVGELTPTKKDLTIASKCSARVS